MVDLVAKNNVGRGMLLNVVADKSADCATTSRFCQGASMIAETVHA